MTVTQILDNMSSAELGEWIAYDRIRPIGELADDYRCGIIAATVANSQSSSAKFRWDDFVPFEAEKEDRREQEQDDSTKDFQQLVAKLQIEKDKTHG